MKVVVLEDAAEDLERGRRFYESCEVGVGDYFSESLLSDLDSLVLFAGIHPLYFRVIIYLTPHARSGRVRAWKTRTYRKRFLRPSGSLPTSTFALSLWRPSAGLTA